LDSRNTETFGGPSGSVSERPIDLIGSKINDTTQVSSSLSCVDEAQSSLTGVVNTYCTGSSDHARFLISDHHWESSIQEKNVLDDEQGTNGDVKVSAEKQVNTDDALLSISESLQSQSGNIDSSGGITVPADATVQLPPRALSKGNEKSFSTEGPGPVKLSGEKPAVNSHGRPGSFRSLSSGHGLSPSSSVGSLSSEKSSLNPYAKEFKLNPNAKSFTPTQTVVRPQSPVSDGSFYYPTNVSTTVQHMHGMPVGYGVGPSFPGHQPVMFNPQVAPPQAYFQPNGPQYGQHMLLGQPRQVVYMPGYQQQEMQYKGRDY
jgi:hypothetical protein